MAKNITEVQTPLDRAIECAGGVGQLATILDVRPNVVSNWRLRGQVPAEHCRAIEAATSEKVTRYDLRPDVFGAPISKPGKQVA